MYTIICIFSFTVVGAVIWALITPKQSGSEWLANHIMENIDKD